MAHAKAPLWGHLLLLLLLNLLSQPCVGWSPAVSPSCRSWSCRYGKLSLSVASSRSNDDSFKTEDTTSASAPTTVTTLPVQTLKESSTLLKRRAWLQSCSVSSARFAAAVAAGYGTSNLVSLDSGMTAVAAAEMTDLALPSTTSLPRNNLQATAALCDPTVSVWQTNSRNGSGNSKRTVVLLGTAHISQLSAELAGTLVREIRPDAVFVELDIKRVASINSGSTTAASTAASSDESTLPSSPSAMQVVIPNPRASLPPPATFGADGSVVVAATPSSTAQPDGDGTAASTPFDSTPNKPKSTGGNWFSRGALNLASAAVGNAVKGMYNNLSTAGFEPGEEFAMAIRAGNEVGAALVLGDQDVQVTLRRLTQALAATDLNQLLSPNSALEQSMAELLPPVPSSKSELKSAAEDTAQFKQDLTNYVERLKSRDSVRTLMAELNQVAPALIQVMLTERDAYMAAGLDTLNQFGCIVAVMGIAHQDGVERNLRERGWTALPLQCAKLV